VANEGIQLIVDTPGGSSLPHNGNVVRRSAIRARIPYVTTLAAARAAMEGIRHMQDQRGAELKSLQEWHREIRAGE
jgi:carbamoyl-phosphate synthase large subunit